MASTSYPGLPASPTLTNPDMILPYGEYDSTPSPQNPYRSPPSGEEWRGASSGNMKFSIGTSNAQLGQINPTTPIIYGNGTMLSDIGEVTEAESTQGRRLPGPAERRMLKQRQNSPLRSSPTMGYHSVMKRAKTGNHQRAVSAESASTVVSEGHAAEMFKDFDDGVSVDDSNFQGDDEESVADYYSEEVIASEMKRLSNAENSYGKEDDRNSSAALSRRAEQILLNAKKRLNNMEGNLTRARSSLAITPSGSMSSIHSSSPLSRSTPSPTTNGHRIVSRTGVPPSKHRQMNPSSDTPNASPGHSRIYSENSIRSNMPTLPILVRSASAAGRYVGKTGMDGSQRTQTKYNSENAGENTVNGARPGFVTPLSRTPPPLNFTLEPMDEDEAAQDIEYNQITSINGFYFDANGNQRGLTRSTSSMQMRDLRGQMQDLKGRLSVLRDRARDDTMQRRSLQSLRTPSPFTAAEQWYAGAKGYGEGGLSADAVVVSYPPWKGESNEIGVNHETEKETNVPQREYAGSEVTSVYEDVSEGHHEEDEGDYEQQVDEEEEEEQEQDEEEEAPYQTAVEDGSTEYDYHNEDGYNDEIVDREEADDYESDVSFYHDTHATSISHEDRADAFDYEHFFLHSAMGTMSQQRNKRRGSGGSFSSDDSLKTTRGPSGPSADQPNIKNRNLRASMGHIRSDSTDTVSTMATFATATEGLGSESGDDYDHDNFAVQHVVIPECDSDTTETEKPSTYGSPMESGIPNNHQPTKEGTSKPSSVIHNRDGGNVHRPSIASFDSQESTATQRSFPLINKPKSSKVGSTSGERDPGESILNDSMTLTEGGDRLQTSPIHMLAKDDQNLVERLVASLGKCVLGLQEAGRASYEGRVYRRRLDGARKILEGQEGPI